MNPTDIAIATRYVCAKDAKEALQFSRTQSQQWVCETIEEARSYRCDGEVDFEIIVIARRIET